MNKQFEQYLRIAAQESNGSSKRASTILKEVLHWDILAAITNSGLGKSLVFQGGTALRMCYNNPRYSEDLDFVRSGPLKPEQFNMFVELLTKSVINKYQLNITVKEPNKPLDTNSTDTSIAVHRWTATIEIGNQATPNQKIHIEVADVPAHDIQQRMVKSHYDQYGFHPILLNVSSKEEILADKVTAVADRPYFKARDIWDIKWLNDTGTELNHNLVKIKAIDYNMVDSTGNINVAEKLHQKIIELASTDTQEKFVLEMSRFLPQNQANLWLKNESTAAGLLMDVSNFLEKQIPKLQHTVTQEKVAVPVSDKDKIIKAWRERISREDKDRYR